MSYHLEPSNTSQDGLYAVDDATGDLIAYTSPALLGESYTVRYEADREPKVFELTSKADAESLLSLLAELADRAHSSGVR